MQRSDPKKHGAQPWLAVSAEGHDYRIYRFRTLAECKAHVLKHVLGFRYDDGMWAVEGWFRLFDRDTQEGDMARDSLAESDCPAWQDRAKSRQKDTKFSFAPICRRCTEESGHKCGKILSGLIEDYHRVIIRTLKHAYMNPRFTLQIETSDKDQEQLGTYWLDNKGVLVIATGSEYTESVTNEVNVVSSYRSGGETLRRQISDDPVWRDTECLQYGKELCRHKRRKAKSILALRTPESWDEHRSTAPVWASLDGNTRSALQALKARLADGEEMRRSQGSK